MVVVKDFLDCHSEVINQAMEFRSRLAIFLQLFFPIWFYEVRVRKVLFFFACCLRSFFDLSSSLAFNCSLVDRLGDDRWLAEISRGSSRNLAIFILTLGNALLPDQISECLSKRKSYLYSRGVDLSENDVSSRFILPFFFCGLLPPVTSPQLGNFFLLASFRPSLQTWPFKPVRITRLEG